jgi:hypothetical protein
MGSIISIVAKAVENHIKRAGARRQRTRLNTQMPRARRAGFWTMAVLPGSSRVLKRIVHRLLQTGGLGIGGRRSFRATGALGY